MRGRKGEEEGMRGREEARGKEYWLVWFTKRGRKGVCAVLFQVVSMLYHILVLMIVPRWRIYR